ncbi:hypothetical protein O6H91_09G068400 [Diphasiastrum complanatum]|nr:hypothetical protein O6H91_09G068400 [Diphasiastrum complanatum]
MDYAAEIKPYKCKFCPATFSQSQALGGHMNRHRQEKMNEQIVHAQDILTQHGFSIAPDQNTARPSMPAAQLHPPGIYTLNQSGVNIGVSSPMANIQPNLIHPLNFNSGRLNWGNPLLNVDGASATGLCEGNLSDAVPATDDGVAALFQPSDYCRPSSANLGAFEMPYQQQLKPPSLPLCSNLTGLNPISIQKSICLNDIQALQSQYELLRNVFDGQAYLESEYANDSTQIDNVDFRPSYGGMKGSMEVSQAFPLNTGNKAYATEDIQNPNVDPSSKSATTMNPYSMEKLRLDVGKQEIVRAKCPKNETRTLPWNHEAYLNMGTTVGRSRAAYPLLPAREGHESEVSLSLLTTPAADISSSINVVQNPCLSAANPLQTKDKTE